MREGMQEAPYKINWLRNGFATMATPLLLAGCSDSDGEKQGIPPTIFGRVVEVQMYTDGQSLQMTAVCQEQPDGSVEPITTAEQLRNAIETDTLTAEGGWNNDDMTAGISCGRGAITDTPAPVGSVIEINNH